MNTHANLETEKCKHRTLRQLMPLCAVVALTLGSWQAGLAQVAAGNDNSAQDAREDWFRPGAEPQALRRALEDDPVSDRWIYHDLDAARQRARESGKPILAVFRCVPCGSAPGLDGAVCTAGGAQASKFEAEIRAAGDKLDSLLDEFVAVRMVKMNGVHRGVFAFDRDVPYVAMFLNADGVVYGRYGTRTSQDRKKLPRLKLTSFQRALERALQLHRAYPSNTKDLSTKSGKARGPAIAEDMPSFKPFPEKYNPAGVKDCVHCHTVGEAEVRQTLSLGNVALRDVWPFPPPESIGVKIDLDDGLQVASVEKGSPADRAGIRAGDVLVKLAAQPLTSLADVQWALHHAPDEGPLVALLRRGDQMVDVAIALEGPWRRNRIHWRASISPLRPNVHLRPDPYRVRKGAEPGQMGLEVRYPRGPAASAGLRNGDLIIAVDGRTDMHLEADFLKYLHIDRPEARSVELTVMRRGEKLEVTLPVR